VNGLNQMPIKNQLDPDLIAAVMTLESGGIPSVFHPVEQ